MSQQSFTDNGVPIAEESKLYIEDTFGVLREVSKADLVYTLKEFVSLRVMPKLLKNPNLKRLSNAGMHAILWLVVLGKCPEEWEELVPDELMEEFDGLGMDDQSGGRNLEADAGEPDRPIVVAVGGSNDGADHGETRGRVV